MSCVYAREPVELVAVAVGEPVELPALRTLDPVPVYLATTGDGTTWWGGYGPPTSTLPGAEPGDYYVDYDTGETYRLVADYFGEVAA